MKESELQAKMLKLIKARGGYTVKVIQASLKGVPDILTCYRGLFIGIEVKLPETKNKASALQKHNIEEIKKAGGIAYVMWDLEHLEVLLDALDRELDETL